MHMSKAHCHRERYFVQIFSLVNDRDGFENSAQKSDGLLHAALQNAHLTEKEVLIFQEEGYRTYAWKRRCSWHVRCRKFEM